MCGIIGYIGDKNAVSVLMDGLKRLEYRGYDSAGIVVANDDKRFSFVDDAPSADIMDNRFHWRKSSGKLVNLEKKLIEYPLSGNIGIGHTRWATHGKPSTTNAHPHSDCRFKTFVVHNGIIENFLELKENLQRQGHNFKSETDTEVIAHLFEEITEKDGKDIVKCLKKAISMFTGAYALGILTGLAPNTIFAVRKDSPLVIGVGDGENFIASDVPALLPYTHKVIYLEDNEIAEIRKNDIIVHNIRGRVVSPSITLIDWDADRVEKQGYEHYMLKEIFEQPQVIRDTISGRIQEDGSVVLSGIGLTIDEIMNIPKIHILACGTAYYAGCVGKYLIENIVRIPVEVSLASEFRYRNPIVEKNEIAIGISQSGETADTIAAIREARQGGAKVVGIINVKGSSLARESDGVLYLHAGAEIGVASTKAYVGMLTVLQILTVFLAEKRKTFSERQYAHFVEQIRQLPTYIEGILANTAEIERLAKKFSKAKDFLFIGRGINYPTAMEGSLKMKEISYIHAEAYAAGEMKHGPIALLEKNFPVLAVATKGVVYEKTLSNMKEVSARGGVLIALATQGDEEIKKYAQHVIYVPYIDEQLSPILNVVPLQLLAYYIAKIRGADVDQPRNLAKSVTVE